MVELSFRIDGAGPYGFRLYEDPLVVSKLRPGSKAFEAGLKEGDVLLSINDHTCSNLTHAAAMSLVENSGHCLNLRVRREGNGLSSLETPAVSNRIASSPSRDHLHADNTFDKYPQNGGDSFMTSSYYNNRDNIMNGSASREQEMEIDIFDGLSPQTKFPKPTSGRTSAMENQKPGVWTPAKHEGVLLTWDLGHPPPPPPQAPVFNDSREPRAPLSPHGGGQGPSRSPGVWSPARQDGVQLTYDLGRPPAPASLPVSDFKENRAPAPMSFQSAPQGQARPPGVWSPARHEGVQLTWDLGGIQSPPTGGSGLNSRQASAVSAPGKHWNETTLEISGEPRKLPTVNAVWKPTVPVAASRPLQSQTPHHQPMFTKFDSDVGYVDELRVHDVIDARRSRDQPAYPGLPPQINKILSEPPDSDDAISAVMNKRKIHLDGSFEQGQKKIFGDSAFYSDPKHNYPTMDEQVKMARSVAMSLTSGANQSARGHQMFLKRKEKSDAWAANNADVTGNPSPTYGGSNEQDLYYNPTPWNPSKTWKPSSTGASSAAGYGYDTQSRIPAPPPLPTSLLFAPNPHVTTTGTLSATELERVRLYDQKVTHDTVAPQVCFNLAKDLRENKGKGGKMFAKRRAKADQWIVENKGPDPAVMMKLSSGFGASSPDAAGGSRLMPKTGGGVAQPGGSNEVDYSLSPAVNRLKEMIEVPKAKMTPWEAVAEYGNVDLAFDHLKDFGLFPGAKSPADTLASSLRAPASRSLLDDIELSPVPAGPPSWMKTNDAKSSAGFSSTNDFTSVSQHFEANRVDFSSKSGSGYRPVQFQSHNQQRQPLLVDNHDSGEGFSEF